MSVISVTSDLIRALRIYILPATVDRFVVDALCERFLHGTGHNVPFRRGFALQLLNGCHTSGIHDSPGAFPSTQPVQLSLKAFNVADIQLHWVTTRSPYSVTVQVHITLPVS